MGSPVNGLVEIRVVEDDIRALSTEFKCDILEIALGRSLHDLPAGDGRTGEGDLLNMRMVADCLTNGIPISNDEVEDASREPNFTNHLRYHESGQRGELGRLHDDSVSGRESGADLPA